jgi:putative DNA primase/helicase
MSENTFPSTSALSLMSARIATHALNIAHSDTSAAMLDVESNVSQWSGEDQNFAESTKLRFTSAAGLRANRSPFPWLVHGLFREKSLCHLFGNPGVGKSFLAIDLAYCISTGNPWHGHVVKKGPVFYVAGEGQEGIRLRLRAWEQHNHVSAADNFFVSNMAVDLTSPRSVDALAKTIHEMANGHGQPSLIIIDTLARNLGIGDENSNSDVGKLIQNVDRQLRLRFQASVLIVHHSGHGAKARPRGASALTGAVDHEYRFDKKDGSCTLTCTKTKDNKPVEPLTFSLETVQIDDLHSDDGKVATSCVLVANEDGAGADAQTLGPKDRLVLASLARIIDEDGTAPPASFVNSEYEQIPNQVVNLEQWRNAALQENLSTGTEEAKQRAFSRAKNRLLKIDRVGHVNGCYWIIRQA